MTVDSVQAKKKNNLAISADDVASYLRENPDFFTDRDGLLAEMTVPHESGKAISLLERQVKILRERSIESRHTLNSLLENAHYNDQLFSVTRHLILSLLEEDTLSQLTHVTESNLMTQPGIDACRLIVLDERQAAADLQNRFPAAMRSRSVITQVIDKSGSQFLFPEASATIRSVALCPVIHHNSLLAVLVIGNHAQDYFSDELDTLFLDFIREVLASLIDRLQRTTPRK